MISHKEIEDAYRKHAPSVLRRAERLLGTRGEALELVHEVFSGLLADPAQYRGESSVLTWLYSATTHACLNRTRHRRTRMRLLAEQGTALDTASRSCSPDAALELRLLLERLPQELAEVAVYHHLDSMTYDEMAQVLGCSRRTVAYRIEQLKAFATAGNA